MSALRSRVGGQATYRYRIWRWCLTIRRGGGATPWPWREIVLSRRVPKKRKTQ